MTATEPQPFDILGELPTGTTVLEASAGTGKTWTIAALVTRYVAEGRHTLDEVLVVTFGRAASRELRERVREQLVAASEALEDAARPRDALLAELCAVGAQERAERARRLRTALTDFDEGTIATIHQFCHQVLLGLGIAGDSDPAATLVEDVDELLMEVVDDLYLRDATGTQPSGILDLGTARAIARRAVEDPGAELSPRSAASDAASTRRVRFAQEVRAELDRRKRRLGILTYDDLLRQVADAVRDPDSPARERLRRRWKVVLIDEFQDTDPVQWEVFDRALSGHATMVLIGDPKQAIYAFRGGDVVTYLQAARTADSRRTLATNWRSDAPLVAAIGRFLEGSALGDREIRVHPVTAKNPDSRLRDAPHAAPFRLRFVPAGSFGPTQLFKDAIRVPDYRSLVARDAAADISRLLDSTAAYRYSDRSTRPVEPSDVAVLAARNDHLLLMQQELRARGVPAVLSGAGSVFRTKAAADWRALLEAMDQPHRAPLARAAALTSFFGYTAEQLDQQGEGLTEKVTDVLRELLDVYRRRGVSAVFEYCSVRGLPPRLLRQVGGERDLTDLRHIAEALHAAAHSRPKGLPALLAWLHEQAALDRPASGDARARRLDSDADAVQLLTIHGSKGLEFPIVYLPFVADRSAGTSEWPLFHTPGDPPQRAIHLGPADAQPTRVARAEDAAESLRLLYVALTRAKSQVVCWWGPGTTTSASALHRVLVDRDPAVPGADGAIGDSRPVRTDEQSRQLLERWAGAGGPAWEEADVTDARLTETDSAETELSIRTFTRVVDDQWRRTSYTGLSRVLEQSGPSADSEAELDVRADEPDGAQVLAGAVATRSRERPDELDSASTKLSPMGELPLGATFGSLVHAVLETADPAADDLAAQIATRIRAERLRWPVADLDEQTLTAALHGVYDTPLGPLARHTTLRRIGRNRLTEMEFEIPLGASVDATEPTTLGGIAAILRRHLSPGDPLMPYADLLEQNRALGSQVLRGYLTGSIDVVLRVGDRYLVADYKTNWLGSMDQPLTLAAYGPAPLAAAMGHSDYPLQALLYAATLHRYLRWRLPDYDPDKHLGGVLYLYLRGMAGAETPVVEGRPTGVFSWRPSSQLVVELSDQLDGAAVRP